MPTYQDSQDLIHRILRKAKRQNGLTYHQTEQLLSTLGLVAAITCNPLLRVQSEAERADLVHKQLYWLTATFKLTKKKDPKP